MEYVIYAIASATTRNEMVRNAIFANLLLNKELEKTLELAAILFSTSINVGFIKMIEVLAAYAIIFNDLGATNMDDGREGYD
jgi:hypothetical protein